MVAKLSKKLTKPGDSSSTISGAASSILNRVRFSSSESSEPAESVEIPEQQSQSILKTSLLDAMHVSHQRAHKLSTGVLQKNVSEATCENCKHVGKDIGTLTDIMKNVLDSVNKLSLKVDDMDSSIKDRFDEIKDNVSKADKSITKIQKTISPTSMHLKNVKVATFLFGPEDGKLLWFIGRQIDLANFVNIIYKEAGSQPDMFLKKLVEKMYGDLLTYYKFVVLKIFVDSKRITRLPLESLDPTGVEILKSIISHYYNRHTPIKVEGSEDELTSRQFFNYAAQIIDDWGLDANIKGGRTIPNVECEFRTHVLDHGYKPTSNFSPLDMEKIQQQYEKLSNAKPTKKQKRKKLLLADNPQGGNEENQDRIHHVVSD